MVLLASGRGFAADPVDQVAERAARNYAQRLEAATQELNDTRQRILREQRPLAEATHQLEERVSALEGEILELQTLEAQKTERRQQLNREASTLHNNINYLNTLAQDEWKTANDGLLSGEASLIGDTLQSLQQKLESNSRTSDTTAALEIVE